MKFSLYGILLGLVLMASCKKIEESVTPQFEVNTTKASYKVGEEVRFNFKGDVDMISFYSGQPSNDYNFKDGREIKIQGEGINLAFSTAVTLGTQLNQLTILASSDFNGDYDNIDMVKKATWTDITDRFLFGTTTTFRVSGTKNIADLAVASKPLYIAFRYVTKPQVANGIARLWRIESFSLNSTATFDGSPLVITDQPGAGFRVIDENKVNAPARSFISLSRVTLWGNLYKDPADPIFDPTNPIYNKLSPSYDPAAVYIPYDPNSPYNDYASVNWAISKPINVDKINLGPDWAIAVKGMDTQPKDFSYVYNSPGKYKVYFIASNSTINGSKKEIRTLDINIEP